MKIYHGSTFVVEKPSLEILNYKTDFGKGFYTTTDFEQAKRWTAIKKKRLEETIKALKTYKLINQISFHTEKALNSIKYIGTEEVCENQ
ncbi:MAG: DUF3990 domain-containing protein [Clostridia bacterium]|nr:DUF3990 domain-containing protein [Clostridia bacterium]